MRLSYLATAAFLAGAYLPAAAAPRPELHVVHGGTVIIPSSSLLDPDQPDQAHTNFRLFVPSGRHLGSSTPTGPAQTPASLACVAGLTKEPATCNVTKLKTVATTGSKAIAIIDAYDDPTAAHDLGAYSKQYGLPAITSSNFQVVYAKGKKPPTDPTGGWEVEESLDIEMAHALAPNAKIYLVEADGTSLGALLLTEKVAIKLVEAAGGGETSNSWGARENKNEAAEAQYFEGTNVVPFVAAGDTPYPSNPAILPNVVSVGGTTFNLSTNGDLITQTSWNLGGSGLSTVIPVPAFQSAVPSVSAIVGTQRGTPDIAFDANPVSGAWIYDTTPYDGSVLQWAIVGGTSLASPAAAAIVNSAGSFNASATAELTEMYGNLGNAKAFFDVTIGQCPQSATGRAGVGYDLCTGIGTPFGAPGK